MSCEIIQFSTSASVSPKRKPIVVAVRAEQPSTTMPSYMIPREVKRLQRAHQIEDGLSITCRNQRLRDQRGGVWRDASALTSYWRACLDWHSALGIAQSRGIADANRFPPVDNIESRHLLVDTWRAALVKQLLTPAPDIGAVAWKRAQLRAENHRYTDVKPERIERAIADDVTFLEAHPTRRSIAASRQSSKPEPA